MSLNLSGASAGFYTDVKKITEKCSQPEYLAEKKTFIDFMLLCNAGTESTYLIRVLNVLIKSENFIPKWHKEELNRMSRFCILHFL